MRTMDSFQKIPDVMTVKEVADFLNVSKKSVYTLLQDDVIRHRKIGRIYRIPKTAIVDYLQNS